jgi:hypothetical protein
MMKICKKCKLEKFSFPPKKGNSDGLSGSCTDCTRLARAKYNREHKKEIAEYDKKYYEDHKEERSEYKKEYRKNHKEEISEYN